MTACAQCSRELQPEWKFCIYCGAWTGVPITEAIAIIRGETPPGTPPPAVEGGADRKAEPDQPVQPDETHEPDQPVQPDETHEPDEPHNLDDPDDLDDGGWDDEPDELTYLQSETPPGGTVTNDTAEVLRAEDIPDDEEAPVAAEVTPVATPRVNILAILALILGCLVSPLAALFGHLALAQIGRTGERGTAIAWVAVVLGYLSLAALLVLGISYMVLNA